jgi:uncharacterized protein YciI
MQFALVAYDFGDEKALERRLAYRTDHLEGLRTLAARGQFISGGALVDESGRMVGSHAHFSFDSREEMDAWLRDEPYVVGQVWEVINIQEVRLFDPNS